MALVRGEPEGVVGLRVHGTGGVALRAGLTGVRRAAVRGRVAGVRLVGELSLGPGVRGEALVRRMHGIPRVSDAAVIDDRPLIGLWPRVGGSALMPRRRRGAVGPLACGVARVRRRPLHCLVPRVPLVDRTPLGSGRIHGARVRRHSRCDLVPGDGAWLLRVRRVCLGPPSGLVPGLTVVGWGVLFGPGLLALASP
ncbi:hypothetical protein [Nocardiopsis sp. CNR-923]|uniref:hypothetical protein n=1 Tax=Nocardiopsis sp. CNR-923 TaxID=1904965 RepID=UPI00130195A3|nr:hypothetical protein [Nocardiopsis sp. CNR-923]